MVIFVSAVKRCKALTELLNEQNFPAIEIHSGLTQPERLKRYTAFKSFESRILVATDLFGRGMDIERVNIVFNYDMPDSSDQYLHRVRDETEMIKERKKETRKKGKEKLPGHAASKKSRSFFFLFFFF